MRNNTVKVLTIQALIAAIYVVLTLAIATPSVIGNQYFLLNTTNWDSDSLIRNWIAPYENGAIATVKTT